MFTGIIESVGEIKDLQKQGSNLVMAVQSSISHELKIDQSISHNGVCLTVTQVTGNVHWVTAVAETLQKSNLGALSINDPINLERCMLANGRFDGHIVQGHVDQVAVCTRVEALDGSWLFDFEYDPQHGNLTVEKGSICVNGVSLTCFNSRNDGFTVTIIPYTYENTTFKTLKKSDLVNLEFDIVGKYIKKLVCR
jgi:riboflavin synthase